MLPIRVVIDTNVVISGLLWGGPPNTIISMIKSGKLEAFVSPALFNELRRVLGYERIEKRLFSLDYTPDEAFSQFASIVIPINSTTQPPVTVCSHAADNVVLWTGLVARPSFIISGDKHLLILKKFRNIDIVTPSAFLKLHGS